MSWLTGKSAVKSRAGDMTPWREALTSEFARAEQDGPLRYGHYDRLGGERIEAVFLTRRSIYIRCYSPISERYYGPLTIVPLDLVLVVGPIGAADSTRWGLVVTDPGADVERGEQPLAAYAYEGVPARGARARAQDLVGELRELIPAGRFRVRPSSASIPESARQLEVGLLLAATAGTPDLRSDLERSWEVLDARSRGLPVPVRAVRSESSVPGDLTVPPPRPPVST
jgi:hypothetical protein